MKCQNFKGCLCKWRREHELWSEFLKGGFIEDDIKGSIVGVTNGDA